jgi:peptidoglycan/xylan/chitin deacetylase (PgdA/CDA1 family)
MINSNNTNINILLYHQIGDALDSKTNPNCFCSIKEFINQMDFLKNSSYKVISLNEAMDMIFKRKNIDENCVVLTFDDGCERFYDVTFPILDKFNFPSTIYPLAGFLGKHAVINGNEYTTLKILSQSMLLELNQLGVEIGAHTMNHVKLAKVDNNKAITEVNKSKDTLEQIIGNKINSFSFPHGDYNNDVIEIVSQAGFTNALTCINGYANDATSAFEMPRKYITYFDTLDNFKSKLN